MTDQPTTRDRLTTRRSEIMELIDSRREAAELDRSQAESTSELSDIDQHPADVASETTQREMTLSTTGDLRAKVDDIDRAIAKLDSGTYGRCEICQQPIEDERLAAIPEATLCKAHADAATQTPGG